MQFNIKSLLVHFLVFSLFVIISVAYFSPVLQGKILNQSDIVQSKGMEHEREVYKQKENRDIYWTNSDFGGMPTYMIGTGFQNDYTLYINKALNFLPRPANFLFLYFFSFYILMLVMGINWKWATLGSLAFGFSTYYIIIIGVGHLAKVRAIAYFPLVIAGILLVFERKKYLLGFILTTMAVALELNTKHYQMTYYLMFAVLILGLFYLIDAYKSKRIISFSKELTVLLVSALLALGMNTTNILPSQEYVKYTIRGDNLLTVNPDGSKKTSNSQGLSKDYITEYSYGIAETFNLLVPRFMGGSNGEKLDEDSYIYQEVASKTDSRTAKQFVERVSTYWGKQPIVAAPAYIGAVTIFLALLSFFFYKGKHKWWILSSIIFALLLSWGKNFGFLTDFFINYVPLYNKFRAVSSIQVIIEFLVPVLAVLGLIAIVNSDENIEDKKKKLFKPVAILGGLLLFFVLFGGAIFDFSSPSDAYYAKYDLLDALIRDRKAMLRADSLRSLMLILLAAGAIYLFIINKLKTNILVGVIALLIIFDMVGIDRNYVNDDSFVSKNYYDKVFRKTEIDKAILKDKSYYRVMNFSKNPLTDGLTSYYHKQLGGYHAAKPRRIQDLFDFYLSQQINPNILNMYNVKYLIVPDKEQLGIQLNDAANGNAWFVSKIDFVQSEDEEILKLKDFDSKETALTNIKNAEKLKFTPYKDSISRIELINYHPEKLVYQSENTKDGFAVFSENYYKNGWQATIDGEKTPIYKVDYSLRGMKIPAGKHKIVFEFKPEVVQKGGQITLVSYIVFAILTVLGLFFALKNRKE
jgi:hypothetical protein